MRLLSKVAIGGGAVSVVTAGALVVGGVFATSATLVALDPIAGPARADSLVAFDNCSHLLDWYVSHAVKDVGPYGWGGPIVMYRGTSGDVMPLASSADSRSSAEPAQGSSGTGTNTQEAAVDEPDIAKTNGKLVVRLTPQRALVKAGQTNEPQMLVITDVSGPAPRTLGRLELAKSSYDSQLLLVGDHVVITQSVSGDTNPIAYDMAYRMGPASSASTRVLDVDISDPTIPRLMRADVYSGSLISARQYGDTIRLVTSTGRPELKWLLPGKGVSETMATGHNKKLVEESTIEDWLPTVTHVGQRTSLLDCDEVMHPASGSGTDTITVSSFDVAAPADRTSVGITADGQVVYSSADRLYVASTRYEPGPVGGPVPGALAPDIRIAGPTDVITDLHAFALDGTTTSYLGSGHVNGSIRDRWSLDEYDGNLRVAWSRQNSRGTARNGVSVLAERAHRLVEIGTVDGLGVDENIQSVRWFDDLAVVVTFRQMDPLYTIDLSDPAHPRELGALKIPGYSGYLHPIGNGLLLGLGVEATDQGQQTGTQAAVFDISDRTHPQQVSRVGFGRSSYLLALDDPRSFTWLPGTSTGVTAVADWSTPITYEDEVKGLHRNRVDALTIGKDGTLITRTIAEHLEDGQIRTLPLDDGRIAVVTGDQVRLIDLG